MEKPKKRVAVTGGSGQIAYNLLFRIANGDLLGYDQPIELAIHDLEEQCQTILPGIVMELEDSRFPLLKDIKISSDPKVVFEDANLAILLGAKPRTAGMERRDLLLENAKIFEEQGKALNEKAAKDILVLVVGNPCNTNCLITLCNAPDIPSERFHAMTRLDQNRASFQLAKKANISINDISNITIWGNHSVNQVPDFVNAQINKKPLLEKIIDRKWLETDFMKIIQQRGSSIIKARGKSSAASAAQAVIDAVRELINPTEEGKWFSSAIYSNDNSYGIQEGLVFSFPCITTKEGECQIVDNLQLDDFLKEKIKLSEKELEQEKELIKHLL